MNISSKGLGLGLVLVSSTLIFGLNSNPSKAETPKISQISQSRQSNSLYRIQLNSHDTEEKSPNVDQLRRLLLAEGYIVQRAWWLPTEPVTNTVDIQYTPDALQKAMELLPLVKESFPYADVRLWKHPNKFKEDDGRYLSKVVWILIK